MKNQQKVLHQHGTLGALMAGLMDGTESVGNVLSFGNFGIGTLSGVNGEMIILDGQVYQAKSDGQFVKVSHHELTPYAAVTDFVPEFTEVIKAAYSAEETKKYLLKNMSENVFYAVKITGNFTNMHVRVMPKQEKPYPRLVEAAKFQPEFKRENITGTIVGFFTPALFQGVAAAGFHLHFIDDTQSFGGHILGFEAQEAKVELMMVDTLAQHFPVNDSHFLETTIDYADLANEIEMAES